VVTEAQSERTTLSRRTVIETALAIGDREGLDAISLRRIARDLSVTPMALYRYVDSKDQLFGALVDRAFDEFQLPTDRDADWRDQLRDLARAFRRVLLAHPAAAALYFVKADTQSFSGLRIVEVVLGVLAAAGFSNDEAALIEGDLERTVLGLVLFETRRASLWTSTEEQEARMREMRGRLLTLPPEQFPRVVASADVLCGSTDPDAAFEFAVELLIGGLEKLLERERG